MVYLYWYAVAQHVCDYCARGAARREIDEKIRGKGGCELKKNDNREQISSIPYSLLPTAYCLLPFNTSSIFFATARIIGTATALPV